MTSLKIHKLKEIHLNGKLQIFKLPHRYYVCDICQKSFTQSGNLRKHQRNIHYVPMTLRQRGNEYTCLQCDLSFTRKSNLKRHQVKIHKMDNKKLEYSVQFVCSVCLKYFSDMFTLRQHKKIEHWGGKESDQERVQCNYEYECAHCEEMFQKKDTIKKHMKLRHFSEITNYDLLKNIMPDMKKHFNVLSYSVLDKNDAQFMAKFSINIKNKPEVDQWLSEFQKQNKITLRKRSIHRSVKKNLVYQVKYGCHHNTKPKAGTNVSPKHTKCEASISVKLFAFMNENKNYCLVKIVHAHNHVLNSLEVLKYREPMDEVKTKFRSMFLAGMTPAQALQQHKKDLEHHHGNEYRNIIGDRGICPNKAWVYNYRCSCMKKTTFEDGLTNFSTQLALMSFENVNTDTKTKLNITTSITNSLSNSGVKLTVTNNSEPVKSTSYTSKNVKNPEVLECDNPQQLQARKIPISLVNHDYINENSPLEINMSASNSINYIPGKLNNFIYLHNQADGIQLNKCPISDTNTSSSNDNFTEHSTVAENVLSEFDHMNGIIKEMVRKNSFLIEGVQQMVYNFHQNIKDETALHNALLTFGKY